LENIGTLRRGSRIFDMASAIDIAGQLLFCGVDINGNARVVLKGLELLASPLH
jgi:hypothetical protein